MGTLRVLGLACLLAAMGCSGHDPGADGPDTEPAIESRVGRAQSTCLGKIGEEGSFMHLVTSGDNRRFACVWKTTSDIGGCVIVDGKPGPEFMGIEIGSVAFSPDGSRLVYKATCGKLGESKQLVVVDGVKTKEYESIPDRQALFSPDGKHVAFVATRAGPGDSCCVVVDGAESRWYEGVSCLPVFSLRGNRWGYTAASDKQTFLVLDGKESAVPANQKVIGGLAFSPDGQRVAYIASDLPQGCFAMVDGKKGATYGYIKGLAFSPDGKRLAYFGSGQDDLWRLVVDGVERVECSPTSWRVHFSPDSRKVAFVSKTRDYDERVVLDGSWQAEFDNIYEDSLVFSPDSKRLAYAAHQGVPGRSYVVVDGVAGRGYEEVGSVRFSPNSQHLAYIARKDREFKAAVLDGKEAEPYPYVTCIAFSPDGLRFACCASGFGTTPSGHYGLVSDLVVDGTVVNVYNMEVYALVFESPTMLHHILFKEHPRPVIYRVAVEVPRR